MKQNSSQLKQRKCYDLYMKFSVSVTTKSRKMLPKFKKEFKLHVQTWFPPCPWQTYTPIRAECSGLAPRESKQYPLAGFRTCTDRNKVAKRSCLFQSNYISARQNVGNFRIRIWSVNIAPAISWISLQQNHPRFSSARLLSYKMTSHGAVCLWVIDWHFKILIRFNRHVLLDIFQYC